MDSPEGKVHFKVYISTDVEVIKRFALHKNHANNFKYFLNKVTDLYPDLGINFQVMWNDSEDMVCISSNEEFNLALSEMKDPLKKFYFITGDIKKCDFTRKTKKRSIDEKNMSHQIKEQTKHQTLSISETKTVVLKPESVSHNPEISTLKDFSECLSDINDNIEKLRTLLINANGTISACYDKSKLQTLKLYKKKLKYIIKKLQESQKSVENTNNVEAIETIKNLSLNVDATNINDEALNAHIDIESAQLPHDHGILVADEFMKIDHNDHQKIIDDDIFDDMEHGPSVKTLSEASSDDENDKWTLLDNEKQSELESLPDIAHRLEDLKKVSESPPSLIHDSAPETKTVKQSEELSTGSAVAKSLCGDNCETEIPSYESLMEIPLTTDQQPTTNTTVQPENIPQSKLDNSSTLHSQPPDLWLTAGLETLYNMGFSDQKYDLVGLLKMFDCNVDHILDFILFKDE